MARRLRSHLGAATRCMLLALGDPTDLEIETTALLPPPLVVAEQRRGGKRARIEPTFTRKRPRLR